MTERAFPRLAILFDKLIDVTVQLEMVAEYLARDIFEYHDQHPHIFLGEQLSYLPPEGALIAPLTDETRTRYEHGRATFKAEARYLSDRLDAFWRCWISFDKSVRAAKAALVNAIPEADEDITNIFERPTSKIDALLDRAVGSVNARFSMGYDPRNYPRSMVDGAIRAVGPLNSWISKLRPLRDRAPVATASRSNRAATVGKRTKKKQPRREARLTELELQTMLVVGKYGGNIAAAARELGKNAKTVRENFFRAQAKARKITDMPSRSVSTRTKPPEDERGQSTLAGED